MTINQVASMGRHEPYTEHPAVSDVWVYALDSRVRQECQPCYGTGYLGYTKDERFKCKICHGLGWTASTDLAVWIKVSPSAVVIFNRHPNMEQFCASFTGDEQDWTDYYDTPLAALLDCIEQALVAEGYEVHPMLKERP